VLHVSRLDEDDVTSYSRCSIMSEPMGMDMQHDDERAVTVDRTVGMYRYRTVGLTKK
jgi:hypothetical protein